MSKEFDFKKWLLNLPTETEFDFAIEKIEAERSKRGKARVAQKERDELCLRTPKKIKEVDKSGVLG